MCVWANESDLTGDNSGNCVGVRKDGENTEIEAI